MKNCAHCA